MPIRFDLFDIVFIVFIFFMCLFSLFVASYCEDRLCVAPYLMEQQCSTDDVDDYTSISIIPVYIPILLYTHCTNLLPLLDMDHWNTTLALPCTVHLHLLPLLPGRKDPASGCNMFTDGPALTASFLCLTYPAGSQLYYHGTCHLCNK